MPEATHTHFQQHMGRREEYPIHLWYKTEQIALNDKSELVPQLSRLAGLYLVIGLSRFVGVTDSQFGE